MKYLFCFIASLMFNYSMFGQGKFDRFTITLGGSLPIFNAPNTIDEFTFVPEGEFLMNFPVHEIYRLTTGIGIESGKHIILEDDAHLVWLNDKIGWVPWEGRYYWNLNFISLKVPVYFTEPLKDAFFAGYTFGAGFGWLLNYNLTEHQLSNTSREEINRSFLNFSFGLEKRLIQFNHGTLGCIPEIGYRFYLTDRNEWQKKFMSAQWKFYMSF